ncbi:VWA domain-containing protein, partial [Sphingobacteriales bacterium CHB3]|nr:VWA domain-containing protein [Sphingobacteriales bacterium CHB3]
ERELTVMLLVDFSKSGSFGSVTQMKNEIAAEICAVLSFSAIKNNDKVGLILFTDTIEKFVPPKKGRAHILRIIRELISFVPTGSGTNIKQALEYFNHVNKKRTIAFLISDFIDEGYDQILRIVSKKHDVIAIELSDPREEQMPDVGLIKMRDAETNIERWIDTGDRRVRAHFEQFWKQRNAARKQLFLRSRVDAIPVRIDRPYIRPIVDFFRLREKRL